MTKAKKPQPMQCSLPFDYLKDVDGRKKYCDQCDRTVHPVKTKAEFDSAMLEGKCVWFERVEVLQVHLNGGMPLEKPTFGIGPMPEGKKLKLSKKPLVWTD